MFYKYVRKNDGKPLRKWQRRGCFYKISDGTYVLTFEGEVDGYTAYVNSSITTLRLIRKSDDRVRLQQKESEMK